MKTKQNTTYTKNAILYGFSLLFEKAAYYGFRAIIILHLSESLIADLTLVKIYEYLGVFSIALLFSKIIGACIGDLAIGNRKAIIIGAFLQALGVLFFWNDSLYFLLIGTLLILIGGGLYSTNLTASFSKEFTNQPSIIDSAFTFLYTLTNLGSFIGILALGYISEINFKYALVLTSILFFLTGFLSLLSSNDKKIAIIKNRTFQLPKRVLIVIIATTLASIYWFIYEQNMTLFYDQITQLTENSLFETFNKYNAIFIGLCCILLSVLWYFFNIKQITKITVGFLLTKIGIGLFLFFPKIPNEDKIYFISLNFMFLSLAETLIAPTVNAMVTKYTNPNYLAIVFSVILLPSYFISKAYQYISDNSTIPKDINLKIGFGIATIVTFLLFISLIILSFRKRKQTSKYKTI